MKPSQTEMQFFPELLILYVKDFTEEDTILVSTI